MGSIRDIFIFNLEKIRGVRRRADIAAAAGVPYSTYQQWERGSIPSGENLAKLARALGVPEGRLFLDPNYSATATEALEILSAYVQNHAQDRHRNIPPDLVERLEALTPEALDFLRTEYLPILEEKSKVLPLSADMPEYLSDQAQKRPKKV